jgi:hypothetical protein
MECTRVDVLNAPQKRVSEWVALIFVTFVWSWITRNDAYMRRALPQLHALSACLPFPPQLPRLNVIHFHSPMIKFDGVWGPQWRTLLDQRCKSSAART